MKIVKSLLNIKESQPLSLELLAGRRVIQENLKDPNLPKAILPNVLEKFAQTFCPILLKTLGIKNLLRTKPFILESTLVTNLLTRDYQMALECAYLISDCKQQAEAFLQLAQVEPLSDKHLRLLKLAEASAYKISDYDVKKDMLLTALFKSYIKSGNLEDAKRVAKNVPDMLSRTAKVAHINYLIFKRNSRRS
jgi:hypothetical protein